MEHNTEQALQDIVKDVSALNRVNQRKYMTYRIGLICGCIVLCCAMICHTWYSYQYMVESQWSMNMQYTEMTDLLRSFEVTTVTETETITETVEATEGGVYIGENNTVGGDVNGGKGNKQ